MLVAGCITATIVLAADAALCLDRGRPWRSALAGAWVMAALGVLAKGLIGIVIPGGVLLIWLLLLRRWRLIGRLLWWPGLLLFALVAVPWFWAMQQRFPDFLHYFFVVQHFQRFRRWRLQQRLAVLVLSGRAAVGQPAVAAVVAGQPQSAVVDGGYRRCRRPVGSPVDELLVAARATVFLDPASKLLGYILPAVPPLAALMARGYALWRAADSRKRSGWRMSLAAAVIVNLGVVIGVAIRQPNTLRDLSGALASRHLPGEPVLMLGKYYYDLPSMRGCKRRWRWSTIGSGPPPTRVTTGTRNSATPVASRWADRKQRC